MSDEYYFVRPDLLLVLQSVETLNSNQKIFHLKEINRILCKYLNKHKRCFFKDNSLIANIKDSLLEKAILHSRVTKSEYKFLIHLQLIIVRYQK